MQSVFPNWLLIRYRYPPILSLTGKRKSISKTVISYHFTELLLEITVLGMLSLPKEFLRFVAIFAILFSKGKKTGSLWKKHR
jgi:hypothetical protein